MTKERIIMKHHKLFNSVKLSLPNGWAVEREETEDFDVNTAQNNQQQAQSSPPQALEATAFNETDERGHLNIKCFQIPTDSTEQQNKLLASVFAETEKHLLGNHVYWGLEELQGEEEGIEVAIKRWLVCSMQKVSEFQLLIFSYSVASASLADESVIKEISVVETTIKEMKFM